jgi:predicted ATPase/class 3 adenylate cyclase/Tfp pilus assembly protein PilF
MIGRALLFADVVDSTRLVGRLGDARAAALWAEHDHGARDLLGRHRGIEVDRSDGFFLLFETVADAVRFAFAYHELLDRLGMRARCGVHFGVVTLRENTPEEVARGAKRMEVEGLAKPLAARVMALAAGGRTLLTTAARDALGGDVPEGAEICSHGHYQLKGIEAPVEILEIGRGATAAFEPPADVDKAWRVTRVGDLWLPARAIPHNLPAERDSFVGRGTELHALAARLDGGVRLLSVIGPGGTGKTRFVSRFAWTRLGDWPGGIYFCDLSETRSLDGICSVVAAALGVNLGHGDALVQLGHAIAGRGRCLLILDNFEQIVAQAAATVGAWLDRTAEARFVVTSRERLQLPGEQVFVLEPLPVAAEGVELFALRALAQNPDFAIDAGNRATVERIVGLLDGLPLAIELAAARARTLSPAQLLDRLKDRFHVLAGARGAAARQATLRAAIDWSWHLLEPWEQAALAQCSVFEGGFTLEAAECVLELSAHPQAPPVLDVVQALLDKSLLRSAAAGGDRRLDIDEPYFGMYLSIHEFAADRLRERGEAAEREAHARHGVYFARFGDDAPMAALRRHGGDRRLAALAREIDNLVAACRRALDRDDLALAVPLFRAAWVVIESRGPSALGVALGERLLAKQGLSGELRARASISAAAALKRAGRMAEAERHLRAALDVFRGLQQEDGEAGALEALALLCHRTGRIDESLGYYRAALALRRRRAERAAEGGLLGSLGLLHADQGRIDEARAHYEQALAIDREVGNRAAEGVVLNLLGVLLAEQGRLDEGRACFEQYLAIARDRCDRVAEGEVLTNLGCLHQDQGRFDEALAAFEQCLSIHREVGNRRFEGYVLGDLGRLHLQQQRWAPARECLKQSLAIMRELSDRRIEGSELRSLGELELALGRLDEAGQVFAEAEAVLQQVGDKYYLGFVRCGQAEVALRAGRREAALSLIEEAESLAAATVAGPGSEFGRRIVALRGALA